MWLNLIRYLSPEADSDSHSDTNILIVIELELLSLRKIGI